MRIFGIENFLLSVTIQDPQKKLIARKCVQKIIKKIVSLNNSLNESIPKNKLKLSKKLYPEIIK